MIWLFVYGSKYIFSLTDIVKDRSECSDLLEKVGIYQTSFRCICRNDLHGHERGIFLALEMFFFFLVCFNVFKVSTLL